MRIVAVLLAVVVGLGLLVVLVGYLLPVKHVATVTAHLPATPEQVWQTLTDVASYPKWRGDVTSVEMLRADSGRVAWREVGKNGTISYAIEQAEAPRRLVTRITDKSLPFGALDARVRKQLRQWLRQLHDEVKVTTILVTHDSEEACEVADRVAVMHDARIARIGTAAELALGSANPFLESFLAESTRKSAGVRKVNYH